MIEGLDETDEAILERAEYEAGLIKDQSVIDNYIKDIQKRIQRESKKPNSGKPQEYEDGTFWVNTKKTCLSSERSGRLKPKATL